VPPSLTIWQTAAAPATQVFMLMGTLVMLPIIVGYAVFVYWTFWRQAARGQRLPLRCAAQNRIANAHIALREFDLSPRCSSFSLLRNNDKATAVHPQATNSSSGIHCH
jgi:hypothetical protein